MIKKSLLILIAIVTSTFLSAAPVLAEAKPLSEEEMRAQGIWYYDPEADVTFGVGCGATSDPTVLADATSTPSTATSSSGAYPDKLDKRWIPIWEEAASKFGIDAPILGAIFLVENRGQADKGPDSSYWRTSPVGAQGPFQFMPNTWAAIAPEAGVKDVNDARDASYAAALYIKKTGYKPGMTVGSAKPDSIAKQATTVAEILYKYNAGPNATASSRSNMPKEAANYVEIGIPIYQQITGQLGSSTDSAGCSTAPVDMSGLHGEGKYGGTPAANIQLAQTELTTEYNWNSGEEWACLVNLWKGESGWDQYAQNPSSTAFGIAQFLDSTWKGVGGTKTGDPRLQIQYGLKYIKARYGHPCNAWNTWQSRNPHWY